MAMQIFLPALPAIQDAFTVSAGQAQLVLSVSLAAIAFSTLFYGPAADSFGRRPVMVVGLVIFLGGSIICAAAPSLSMLILGRVVQAVGGAAGIMPPDRRDDPVGDIGPVGIGNNDIGG